MFNELIPKDSVEQLVAKRDLCIAKVDEAFELLKDARALAGQFAASDGSYAFVKILGYTDEGWQRKVEELRRTIDRDGWIYLAQASGMKNLMDTAAWREFNELLSKDSVPLSIDTVYSTFNAFADSKRHIFERGIVNVFKNLCDDYVSNSPFSIGRRMILVRAIEGHSYARYEREQLSDIDRILHIVDGKSPPDHLGDASAQVLTAHRNGERERSTTYMHLRWYKNGNVHAMILDSALIDRINELIASYFEKALPDATGR